MAEAESKADFGDPPAGATGYWLAEIRAYDKTFDGWQKRAERVVKRYRNETNAENPDRADSTKRFNVLWSNVQTLQPALYSRPPKPDITRTYKDRSPVARAAATILERATRSQILAGGFDGAMRAARDDYLLTARGQSWVRYVPTYGEEQRDKIFLQADTAEDGSKTYLKPDGAPADLGDAAEPPMADGQPYMEAGEPYRPVVSECVKQEHVGWKDFGHTPAPNWSKVRAVWKREMMTRDQLIERFGKDKGENVSLTRLVPNIEKADAENYGDAFRRAEVFEIWDKPSGKVLWISQGYTDGPLDEIADPLHLEGFFPCPEPIYGTRTTDSLVPVPDYDEYRTQAEEIDRLTQRISLLTEALKVAGAYDGNFAELGKILSKEENTLVPVDNWAMFAERGGIAGAISFLPIKEIADTIANLGTIRQQLKQDIQEITGISDIVRGQSDPNETLGAQNIKRQFVGMRIKDRQDCIERFARDIVKITAEIIAEQFSPETLWGISGYEHSDEARTLDRAVAEWQKAQQAALQQMLAPPMPGETQPGMAMGGPEGMPPAPMTDRPPSSREVFEQAVALLRSDRLRGYTITIETDSMVLEDQQVEKQIAVDFVTSITGFLQLAVPAAQQFPDLKNVLGELLMFSVRQFKAASSLEAAFEEMVDTSAEASAPPPDPAAAGEAAKAKIEEAKLAQTGEHNAATLAFEEKKHNDSMALEREKLTATQDKDKLDRRLAIAAHNKDVAVLAGEEQPIDGPSVIDRIIDKIAGLEAEMRRGQQAVVAALNAPTEIVRDASGRPKAVRKGGMIKEVVRGPDGRVVGLQ